MLFVRYFLTVCDMRYFSLITHSLDRYQVWNIRRLRDWPSIRALFIKLFLSYFICFGGRVIYFKQKQWLLTTRALNILVHFFDKKSNVKCTNVKLLRGHEYTKVSFFFWTWTLLLLTMFQKNSIILYKLNWMGPYSQSRSDNATMFISDFIAGRWRCGCVAICRLTDFWFLFLAHNYPQTMIRD